MKRLFIMLLSLVLASSRGLCAAPAEVERAVPMVPRMDPHSEFLINVWQTSDGLPINVLQDLEQTPEGYLWIGTSQGLTRFDGNRFELFFSTPTGARYGARSWPLEVDLRGRLWVGVDQVGLAIMDTNGVREVQTNGVLGARVESLCWDGRDSMYWVDAQGSYGRISIADPGKGEKYRGRVPSGSMWLRDGAGSSGDMWLQTPRGLRFLENGKLVEINPQGGPTMTAAGRRGGGLWVASQGRLRIVGRKSDSEVATFPWAGAGGRVTSLLEDQSGRVWVGSAEHGLYCYEQGNFKQVLPMASSVLCLLEDMHGSIWAGTRGGGLIQARQRHFFVHDLRSGLANEFVNSLCEDKEGRVWIASAEGNIGWWESARGEAGVASGEGTRPTRRWHKAGQAEGWPQAEPVAVAPGKDGGVFVSTAARQIFRWSDGRFAEVRFPSGGLKAPASDLLHDSRGRLWMVTDNLGILCFDGGRFQSFSMRDGLPSMYMRRILEDEQGDILAGDWEGGIVRFDGKRWQTVRKSSGHRDAVRSIAISGGTLWIGTSAGGLLRFKDGQTRVVSIENGLPDICIQQLLLDGKGALWGSTPHRLFRLSLRQLDEVIEGRKSQLQAITYGRSDGLPATSFAAWNDPRSWRTADGELWFATANGAIHFRPDRLPESKAPQALIEQTAIDSKLVGTEALRHLRTGTRVDFRFTAPCLTAPERVRFRYQLSGVDPGWVEAESRLATYASLPPGKHVFRVVACSPEGAWGTAPASVTLDVYPYFWQTNWFWAIIAGMAVGSAVWFARRAAMARLHRRLERLRQEQAVHRERARIAQDIHDELGANLTSIGLMADMGARHKADTGAMARELQQISDTARESVAAMDAIVWALNPRNDSLDHFANYLAQFTRDFFRPTGLRTRLELPANLPARSMSTEMRHQLLLIVKECYNNIVRHSHADEVRLELAWIEQDGADGKGHGTTGKTPGAKGGLRMTISDNGKGLSGQPAAEGQDGLMNLRNRITALGGAVEVESGANGTRLDFSLPLSQLKASDI